MKKRLLSVLLTVSLISMVFSGCGQRESASDRENNPAQNEAPADVPVVYMTTDISSEGLMAVYEALNWEPEGKVAVKLSTGEPQCL